MREDLIWRIDRVIKSDKKKLKGKRNLKKLKELWSKTFFGKTAFFKEFGERHKKRVLKLSEYKDKIINAKDLTEVMNLREKVNRLLFTIDFK